MFVKLVRRADSECIERVIECTYAEMHPNRAGDSMVLTVESWAGMPCPWMF